LINFKVIDVEVNQYEESIYKKFENEKNMNTKTRANESILKRLFVSKISIKVFNISVSYDFFNICF
jgi:hypothetical protein